MTTELERRFLTPGQRRLTGGRTVLVEEFLDGPEVSVSGFSVAGEYVPLLVTDRVCAEPPAFGVPLSESWPSPHAAAATPEV